MPQYPQGRISTAKDGFDVDIPISARSLGEYVFEAEFWICIKISFFFFGLRILHDFMF